MLPDGNSQAHFFWGGGGGRRDRRRKDFSNWVC